MDNLPPNLNSNSPEAKYINAILDELRSLRITVGPGLRVRKTRNGTVIEVDRQQPGSGGSGEPVWLS